MPQLEGILITSCPGFPTSSVLELGREPGKRDLPSPVLALPDRISSVFQGEKRTVRIDLGASGKMKSLCLDLCTVPVERS